MQKRNPLAVVGLSIITFGIYDLYWLAKTKSELNQHTKTKVPSIWLLIIPIILATFAYILAIIGLTSSNTSSSTTSFGSNTTIPTHTAVLALVGFGVTFICIFAFIIIAIIWFFKFSKAVNEYTQGKMSTAVCFLILYLIHLIGVALIQDTFNDMIDAGVVMGPGQPIPAAPGVTPGQVPPQPAATVQPMYQQPVPQLITPAPPAEQPMPQPVTQYPSSPEPTVPPVQPPVDANSNSDTTVPPVQ